MPENSLQPNQCLQDNPLGSHLHMMARSFMEDGYADVTVRMKLGLLADFGQWFGRTGLAVTHVDERLVDAFFKHRKQVRGGDLKTLEQFLNHLRKCAVISDRDPVRDISPLADNLSRYEKHLRAERGLVSITILHYLRFVRRFLVERFRKGPFLLREVKPSDVSNFVLRHGQTMAVKNDS